ncbi:hypothetical protein FACS1894188_10510 [Clostridia bacterium]|nr:hypothetical protein FACS1894188_10510 [Clostridia bacterium]
MCEDIRCSECVCLLCSHLAYCGQEYCDSGEDKIRAISRCSGYEEVTPPKYGEDGELEFVELADEETTEDEAEDGEDYDDGEDYED